jgi:hypothetical protein
MWQKILRGAFSLLIAVGLLSLSNFQASARSNVGVTGEAVVGVLTSGTLYEQAVDPNGQLLLSAWLDPNGSDNDEYVWDNFTLSSNAMITGIVWYGVYDPLKFGKGGPVLDFSVSIYPSIPAGTEPAIAGAPLVTYQTGGNAGESAAGTVAGATLYAYTFNLPTSFVASAGVKYWLQIEASQQGLVPDWNFVAGSAGNGSHYWRGRGAGGDIMYRSLPGDAAFSLLGTTQSFAVTISKSGKGSGTVTSDVPGIDCGLDCSEVYASNTSVTLTASAASGSTFEGWSGGGCSGTGICSLTVTAANTITAVFNNVLQTFADVPPTHKYYKDIETLYANGLTGGCSTAPMKYCPDQTMNRGEAAVFNLRANFGSSYVPPVPTHFFQDDWSKGAWAETWAEGMYYGGLSAGCSSNPPKYCPWDQIPREQAVIFALRMKYGTAYTPPPASGTMFADMTDTSYYATQWAEQAYTDGLIPNCGISGGKPLFCPKDPASRGLGAYIIVRAKSLTMP